jgi:hypothetical protein
MTIGNRVSPKALDGCSWWGINVEEHVEELASLIHRVVSMLWSGWSI